MISSKKVWFIDTEYKNINRKTHKVVVRFMEHNGSFHKCYVTNDYPHQTFAV